MNCSICLETIQSNDNVIKLNCCLQSKFHKACWLRWCVNTNTCPLCRTLHENTSDDKSFIHMVKNSFETRYNFIQSTVEKKINMRKVLIKSIHNYSPNNIKLILDLKNTEEFKLDIDGYSARGFTILHDIVLFGKLNVLKYYLRHFGNHLINKTTINCLSTPLHIAVMYQRYNIARILIQNGAVISKVNYSGQTPIHIAFRYKSSDLMIRLLLKNLKGKRNINESNFRQILNLSLDHNRFTITRYIIKCIS
jgi:hypothetical protein